MSDKLVLAYNAYGPHLVDLAGGVWWPNDTARAAIEAAEDAKAEALSQEAAGQGEWKN